ncbi:MAG: cation:proton antiporter [Candidatus Daviesbacteria bacterium]|nr:cation:proton antiporter [Candidatus Daviesbacteria bacterium]
MNNIFIQLAIILSFSSILGMIVYKFKLPLLIAYLVTGLLLSIAATFDVSKSLALSFLPDIGIAFVLFLVGMELDLRELKNFGRQILTAGILQVVITATLGTYIAQSFGFNTREAIYLGLGLSFSSTMLVVKLLIDKKDLTSLYGKLSVGVLLLEDLLAVVILLIIGSSMSILNIGESNIMSLSVLVLKVVILFSMAILISRYILSVVFKAISDSGELLLLTALAWCFGFITLSMLMGFSILIGAFLAGVALASSPYHFHIQGKIKPMRDFFTALFFVYLGTRVNFSLNNISLLPLILIFTTYVILIKPVIFLLLFGLFGFRKHTMFKTAINLSQVSEFSMIILLIGFKANLVSQNALTVIALSSVISFIASSLIISKSHTIYKLVSSAVSFFERRKHLVFEKEADAELSDHVVVVGAHRVGGEIVRFLKKEKHPMVVLDFNPHQVETLLKEEIPVIYGDMSDPEVLDILNLDTAKMIISTAPDLGDSKTLLEDLKLRNINIPIIVRAETIREAQGLYKLGADLVILPEVMAGDLLLDMLRDHLSEKSYFKDRPRIELEKLSRKTLSWG